MMRKTVFGLAVMMTVLLVTGCQTRKLEQKADTMPLQAARVEELHDLSLQLTAHLLENDYGAAIDMMDSTMAKAMAGKLESVWSQLADSLGTYLKDDNYVGMTSGNYEALEMTLRFEKGSAVQRVVFDKENRISGLRFRNGDEVPEEQALHEAFTEREVTVDAGDGYPLRGRLSIPKTDTPLPAIVLVHGSGPCDMDESVGKNAPFRDLSAALAERGFMVLRYDKRTYTHGAEIAAHAESASMTVDEEVVHDALAAVALLKSFEGVDTQRVYLLGHSMGGGLLSYINDMGADCAGYVIMAGTPRKQWELSAEQILSVADDLEEAGNTSKAAEARNFVETEKRKADDLLNLGIGETIFGIPARYHQKLAQIDPIALHMKDQLPVLILQGEEDRQVNMLDYSLWQEGLKHHPRAAYISYPRLNHLFGEYHGEPVPYSQIVQNEYGQQTPVPAEVMDDIANWLSRPLTANGGL